MEAVFENIESEYGLGLLEYIEERLMSEIGAAVAVLDKQVSLISKWENHALQKPTPELLETHARVIKAALRLAAMLKRITDQEGFTNKHLREVVRSREQLLNLSYQAWHNPMPPGEADAILAEAFG